MLSTVKVLAGAVALAIAGTASAQTFNNTDLYLNINNFTINNGIETSSSYLVDLGINATNFNPSQSYSFTLTGDSNFTGSAYAGSGSNIDYSVVGGNGNGTGQKSYTIDTTTNTDPGTWGGAVSKSNEQTALSALQSLIPATGHGFTSGSSTLTSAVFSSGWGQGQYEGAWALNALNNNSTTPYVDAAAVGTALNFYQESGTAGITANPVTTFAGTWNLSNGVLTYTPTGTAVPLPTPVLLLLSGLGLMGVVMRRGKPSVGGFAA
jgi:hypothetical protein